MDPRTARKITGWLQDLERTQPRLRIGVITDDDPLAVAVGGSDVSYTSVSALAGPTLAVDDVVAVLTFGNDLLVLSKIVAGASTDPTFGFLTLTGGMQALGGQVSQFSYLELEERPDPVGVADHAFVYARDNGSGKTELCVQFPTGAPIVLATEP